MQVEKIEDWAGQEVVASDGEKVGKLEDVYYAGESGEAILACVKTGRLGRKLHVVPLEGSAVARDHLKIAYTKSEVENGPRVDGGAELGPAQQDEVARHFGIDLPAGGGGTLLESGQARLERRAKLAETADRARELEQAAAEKREQADLRQQEAGEAAREAERLEDERREADAAAARLRTEGDLPSEDREG